LDAINHATALAPTNPVYWYETALCLKELNRLDEGNAALAKSQQLGGIPGLVTTATTLASLPGAASASALQPATNPAPTNAASPKPATQEQNDRAATVNSIKALLANHQTDQALLAAQHLTETRPD